MKVGICRVILRIPENQSLKGKRRVIHSLCSRVRNRFDVAISETDYNQSWKLATLGIVCVSNSSTHIDQVIHNVVSYIENLREDVELIECERQIISEF